MRIGGTGVNVVIYDVLRLQAECVPLREDGPDQDADLRVAAVLQPLGLQVNTLPRKTSAQHNNYVAHIFYTSYGETIICVV